MILTGTEGNQDHYGMHRRCELELLAQVATDIGAKQYLELGCGQGCGLEYVTKALPNIDAVGYEWSMIEPVALGLRIDRVDLWSDEFAKTLAGLTLKRPLFVHTDNGNKRRELAIVAPYLVQGDILGTHDYAGEVTDDKFLTDAGFTLATQYEDWIRRCGSLQRFWYAP